ncbi:MAG: TIGR03086 family metal-binding protein [Ilumatobacteraceae bacterium]
MSENLRWFTKAIYQMDHVVRLASPDDPTVWDRPSPCAGWAARDVLGHVIAVQRSRMAKIEPGSCEALDPFDRPGRHGGDDPAGTWAQVRDEVLALLDRPGVLQRAIRTSSGEDTVDAALGFNIADTTIHAWDLARALGVDDRLDPGLVARVVEVTEPRIEMLAAAGHFAPGRAPDDDASPQERLLALVGRADMGR